MDSRFVVALVVAALLGWLVVPGAVASASAPGGVDVVVAGGSGIDATALDRVRAGVVGNGLSRVDTDGVLEQSTRADIYAAIERTPGVALDEIAATVGVAKSTARYHVNVLRGAGLVDAAIVAGAHRFAPAEADAEVAAALRADATGPVLRAVARNEPASVTDVAVSTDRAASTVSHHLSALEARGLVERERVGESVATSLAPATRDALTAEVLAAGDE